MKTIEKTVLIWYSAQEMFDMVTAVADYPLFLPWCDHATVIASDDSGMTAELGLSIGALRQRFTTRNTHVPGQQVRLQLVDGPFSNLQGEWRFVPVGKSQQRACKIYFSLTYGFDSSALQAVVSPVFDGVASSLVDAFVKRAQKVYGNEQK